MSQDFAGDLFAMTNDAEVDMGNVENALNTLKSSFSGPSAPSAEQGQLWYDTTRSLLRHRGATSQWRGVIAFNDDANYLNITKIWVYANAAEEGFTEDDDCADSVIALKGGSYAYNVTGGDGEKRGQWEISGITSGSHALTEAEMPSHYHQLNGGGNAVNCYGLGDSGNTAQTIGGPGGIAGGFGNYSNAMNTAGSGNSHNHTNGTGDEQWRPQAAVGIMIYPAII